MRLGCIYKIKCGERFIIGSSLNPTKRFIHHKYKLNNKTHDNDFLQNVFNKYGEVYMEILQSGIPEDVLRFVESIWIGALCSKAEDDKFGMNIIDGDRIVFTDSIIDKKSKAQRSVMKNLSPEDMSNRMKKMVKSKEPNVLLIGKKISYTKSKNPKLDWENKQTKPVVQMTKSGEFVKLWASAYQAQKEEGFRSCNISGVCLNRYGQRSHRGFKWKFATEEDLKTKK